MRATKPSPDTCSVTICPPHKWSGMTLVTDGDGCGAPHPPRAQAPTKNASRRGRCATRTIEDYRQGQGQGQALHWRRRPWYVVGPMAEKKGFGSTVLGWFVVRDGAEQNKEESADELIAKYANQEPPPPPPEVQL